MQNAMLTIQLISYHLRLLAYRPEKEGQRQKLGEYARQIQLLMTQRHEARGNPLLLNTIEHEIDVLTIEISDYVDSIDHTIKEGVNYYV